MTKPSAAAICLSTFALKSADIKVMNGSVKNMEKNSVGKMRKNLLFIYRTKSKLFSFSKAEIINDVIKYPENVKNISTPKNPPGRIG